MWQSRSYAAFATALALCLIVPGRSDAQGLRFTPWLGAYAPSDNIGTLQTVTVGKQHTTFAFGGDLDIGSPVGIVIEANDYMSRYEFPDTEEESRTVHDLFFKVGLSFGMGGGNN